MFSRTITTGEKRKPSFRSLIQKKDELPAKRAKVSGSDIGDMTEIEGSEWMTKTTVTMSLPARSFLKLAPSETAVDLRELDKAMTFLDTFIMGSYTRLTGIKDPVIVASLKADIIGAFWGYFRSKEGKALASLLKKDKRGLTSHEVALMYQALIVIKPTLKDVIGLASFADTLSGAFSQYLYNDIAKMANLDYAEHAIFMTPNGIYQGSKWLTDAKPFDKFLLASFDVKALKEALKDKSPEEAAEIRSVWLKESKAKLVEALKDVSLKGLCLSTLFRLIMGESADNGPDNTIITKNGVVAIDLTGFRYPRQKVFNEALGWDSILGETDADKLMTAIFDGSVFKMRFLDDVGLDNDTRKSVERMIVDAIKVEVQDDVVAEVASVRDWFNKLDVDAVNANLDGTTRLIYEGMPDALKFSPGLLDGYIKSCKAFISAPVAFLNPPVAVVASLNQL